LNKIEYTGQDYEKWERGFLWRKKFGWPIKGAHMPPMVEPMRTKPIFYRNCRPELKNMPDGQIAFHGRSPLHL